MAPALRARCSRREVKVGFTPQRPNGFTLIEMMTALVILAVIVGVGVPTFIDATLSSRLNAYANNIVVSSHLARSEAIKRNVAVTMCSSTDGTTCASGAEFGAGWILVANVGGAPKAIHTQSAVGEGFSITANSAGSAVDQVVFQPSGVGATQAIFVVCRQNPSPGAQERVVTVSATGKPTVTRTSEGVCL